MAAKNCVESYNISDMDRRNFIQSIGFLAAAIAMDIEALFGTDVRPRVAITIDDPNFYPSPLLNGVERDQRIRKALREAGARAALFVCGERIDSLAGKRLLKDWDLEGHIIANHSYSHSFLPSKKIGAKRLL